MTKDMERLARALRGPSWADVPFDPNDPNWSKPVADVRALLLELRNPSGPMRIAGAHPADIRPSEAEATWQVMIDHILGEDQG